MSYPINQKIVPTYQPAMGLNGSAPLQNVDPDKIQQGITQNSALKGVTSGEEKNSWLTPVMTIPVFIGMALGMDKFNKACGDEVNIMKKIGDWGDKVGSNKFFQSEQAKSVGNAYNTAKTFVNERIINKNKILSAMFNTPSEPQHKMVKMMKKGTIAEISSDAIQKMEEHIKSGGSLKFKDDTVITKEAMEKLSKESHTTEGIDKIIELCEHNRTVKIDSKKFGKLPKWISKEGKYISDFKGMQWLGNLMGREVHLAEYANKMNAFKSTNKTWLGKVLPKFTLRLVEGLTNGTAGGKIAILMGAFFVADAIKKTIDAPKGHGEKGKTFAENLIYNEAMYLTMPLGLKIMHGMGGLQYIGVDKTKLETFRKEQTIFNDAVKAGNYKDKATYSAEVKRIKSILKPEIKGNGFTKFIKGTVFEPLKAAARFLTVGLENFESFNPKGITKASSFGERLGHFFQHGKAKGFKWALGGPTRFIFYLFLIAPPLGKLGAKASHLVFGRPTKSVLDEEKEPEKAKTPQVIMPNQAIPAAQVMQPTQRNQAQMNTAQSSNLLDMNKAQANQRTMTVPQEPVRSYIPSSEGVKIQPGSDNKDALGLQAPDINVAMSKADNAELTANKFTHK